MFLYEKNQKCGECNRAILKQGDGQYRCRGCINLVFGLSRPLEGLWTRHQDQERELYRKDIAQPFKKDGRINRDFVKAYGAKTIAKEMKVKEKEVLRAVDL